ncbi:MAG: c-type cytochrome, partial [Opitutales bacterium]|nr:c-type cytochrome [Opitutales bacterium]
KRGAQYLAAIGSQTNLERPDSWGALLTKGARLKGPKAKTMLTRIRARLGDVEAFPHWRTILSDTDRLPRLRSEAMEILELGGDSEVGPLAASLLTDPALRQAALSALPRYLNDSIAEQVIDALPGFPLTLRNEGINLLASRPTTTQTLLDSIESGELNGSLVSPVLMRQMRNHGVEKINELMDLIWGPVNPSPPNLPRQVRKWKYALTPERLERVDLSYGRHVFENTCGTCHKLFDEGVTLGPDLTGSNRANLDYLLENVLAPNSLIGNAYQLNVFTTKDGRTVSGMARKENDANVTVAMVGGSEVVLRKDEIVKRQILEQSMMPAGLFDAIPETDVAALVAYLASASQVEKWKGEK